MKIQLYGGPRDGQEFDIGSAGPWPAEITVQLCLATDYVGNDLEENVPLELVGRTTIYRDAGCGKHYVHDGMRGHRKT